MTRNQHIRDDIDFLKRLNGKQTGYVPIYFTRELLIYVVSEHSQPVLIGQIQTY